MSTGMMNETFFIKMLLRRHDELVLLSSRDLSPGIITLLQAKGRIRTLS